MSWGRSRLFRCRWSTPSERRSPSTRSSGRFHTGRSSCWGSSRWSRCKSNTQSEISLLTRWGSSHPTPHTASTKSVKNNLNTCWECKHRRCQSWRSGSSPLLNYMLHTQWLNYSPNIRWDYMLGRGWKSSGSNLMLHYKLYIGLKRNNPDNGWEYRLDRGWMSWGSSRLLSCM